MKLPLQHKTILVTRSEHQSSEWIAKLEGLGAKTIALPLIATKAIHQTELNRKIINGNYTWIVFTSPNAVRHFFETVAMKSIESNIAAVGSKTKACLEKLGVKVDFLPSQFTAQQLASEIPITPNDRLFIPRSNLAKNTAVELLESRGCTVETLAIYENTAICYSKKEIAAVLRQKIDFITFTSGSIVTAFMKLEIPLQGAKVICIGPETEQVAAQHQLATHATANPHNLEGMVNALLNFDIRI